MGLKVRRKFSDQTGAPRTLVEEISGHKPARLAEIQVQVYRDKRYLDTPLAIAEIDDESNDGVTPDELARKLWDLIVQDAKSSGATRYRAVYGVRTEHGVSWHQGEPIAVTFDDEGGVMSGAPPGSESVDLLRLAKEMVRDSHTRHMDSLDHLLPIVRDLSEKRGEVDAKIAEIEASKEEDRNIHETRREWAGVARGVLEKFAEPFGVTIGDFLDDYARTATGVDKRPLFERWKQLFEKIDAEKLAKLEEHLGADYWKLVEKLLECEDDETFRSVATNFTTRVAADPRDEEIVAGTFFLLGPALGSRFSTLLKEATGQT